VRLEILIEANIKAAIFWDITPCSLVEMSQRFVERAGVGPQIRVKSVPIL
jgi:hypothetical protein